MPVALLLVDEQATVEFPAVGRTEVTIGEVKATSGRYVSIYIVSAMAKLNTAPASKKSDHHVPTAKSRIHCERFEDTEMATICISIEPEPNK